MKKFILILLMFLWAGIASAEIVGDGLEITELDGSPTNVPYKLKVTNGTLTDNGDGTMTLSTGSGFNWTNSSTIGVTNTSGNYTFDLNSTLKSNYDTAYTDRLKWDGGATGLVALTGRNSLELGTTDSPTFANLTLSGWLSYHPRITYNITSATPAINVSTTDIFSITALATDITSMSSGLSGTPINGQKLMIIINGTAAQNITWGTSYKSISPLPTLTIAGKQLFVGLIYNATGTSQWSCISSAQE